MITEKTFKRLAALDPSDVEFHAVRYDSGSCFQEAILLAQNGSYVPTPESILASDVVESCLRDALKATAHDGGNYGVIPCLGGEPNEVWEVWKKERKAQKVTQP